MSIKIEPEVQYGAQATPQDVQNAVTHLLEAAANLSQAAFLVRALHALTRLAPVLDETSLAEVAATTSDYAALVRALQVPAALGVLMREDPLAAARLRGLRDRERLLAAEGGTLSGREIAAALGITRQAVDKRRRRGRLLGLALGRRGYRYPGWQLGPAGIQPGLDAVLGDLEHHDPWMQLRFMLNPNARLDGETPLAALRRGDVDRVRRAARTYGEQGAA